MPTALDKFPKQPGDTEDFDISFEDYLLARDDTIDSHEVTVPDGINVVSSAVVGGVVKLWVSGGTNGKKYRITVTVTTTGGRIKNAEIDIEVREI